jgi:hypothetical protein
LKRRSKPLHFSVFLWSVLQDFVSGGLSQDATSLHVTFHPLHVTETVHKSANGPLHNGRCCEGNEPQSWTQDLHWQGLHTLPHSKHNGSPKGWGQKIQQKPMAGTITRETKGKANEKPKDPQEPKNGEN